MSKIDRLTALAIVEEMLDEVWYVYRPETFGHAFYVLRDLKMSVEREKDVDD